MQALPGSTGRLNSAGGLGPLHKVVFEEEEMPFGMPTGFFGVSLAMPIPIIMKYCSDRQWVKERVLKAMKGEEIWCQLLPQPSGGSDLAGLRTKAEPDGPSGLDAGWKVNGQKLWSTWAQYSDSTWDTGCAQRSQCRQAQGADLFLDRHEVTGRHRTPDQACRWRAACERDFLRRCAARGFAAHRRRGRRLRGGDGDLDD